MTNLNMELVKKELRILNLIKIIIVFFTVIVIVGTGYCIYYRPIWQDLFCTFYIFYFLVCLYCHIVYCDDLVKTAYILIAETFGYQSQKEIEECQTEEEFKIAIKEFDIEKKIFSDAVFKFGLFRKKWDIEYVDYLLMGTRDNYKFTVQDFLLKFTRKHIKTRYKQLTVDTVFPINCNIIIRRSKLIKWCSIKKLKQIQIGDEEFEKCYEIYTDNLEEAQKLLNEDFIFELLKYNKIYGRRIEVIITPKKIFLLNRIRFWELIFKQDWHWNIFVSPKKEFNKIWADIDNFLNVLPIVSLLGKKE